MSKDQAYGGLILIISLLITLGYIVAFFAPYVGLPAAWRDWAVAVPVFLFVVAVLVICMWIGWTMLTTPPPAPLEAETLPAPQPESKPGEAKTESKT